MRAASWTAAALLGLASLAVHAAVTGDGLTPGSDDKVWPRWQTRLAGDGNARTPTRSDWGDAGLKQRSVGVLGDYYFSRSTWIPHTQGGFRATGAMFFGPRGDDSTGLWQSSRYTLAPFGGRAAGLVAAPYAGIGYTAMSASRVWGFRADLGLMTLRPSSASGSAFGLEEAARDARLSPLLQLGVSYSF